WLKKNHAHSADIWLVFFKKGVGKPSVTYAESVQEAICFGWIDGLKKRIDDERYCHRFSPRKTSSKWTPKNIEIAQRMIGDGTMTTAGRASFDRRQEYDAEFLEARGAGSILSVEIEAKLKANEKAWTYFQSLPPGYRKQYIQWLMSAKRETTRQRRLGEALRLLEQNRKLGMK
ncbi:bacteriocin-protection protein, partial [bacterium]